MSEETDSTIEVIYIQLLNEGTTVFRPTNAVRIEDRKYCILPTSDYDAQQEEWEFLPGSVVICEWEQRSGNSILVARHPYDIGCDS